jgi:hypothetical protein
MDKGIAERWVAALRSGEYEQTTQNLRDYEGFCCLGVLCDIHRVEQGTMDWDDDFDYGGDTDRRGDVLPLPVLLWAGMKNQSGTVGSDFSLVGLNDDDGKTFPEIADVIEQNWEVL